MTARRLLVPATIAAITVAAIVFAACSDSSSDPEADTQDVEVTLTSAGCDPATIEVAAGRLLFHVHNNGAAAVTEFELLDGDHVLGEVENLVPGLDGTLAITLEEGEYTTYCPGGTSVERGTLRVTAPSP